MVGIITSDDIKYLRRKDILLSCEKDSKNEDNKIKGGTRKKYNYTHISVCLDHY